MVPEVKHFSPDIQSSPQYNTQQYLSMKKIAIMANYYI
jgi:hypothetical protein